MTKKKSLQAIGSKHTAYPPSDPSKCVQNLSQTVYNVCTLSALLEKDNIFSIPENLTLEMWHPPQQQVENRWRIIELKQNKVVKNLSTLFCS